MTGEKEKRFDEQWKIPALLFVKRVSRATDILIKSIINLIILVIYMP